METKYVIGIDAGGSSTRAFLFDFSGKIVARETEKAETLHPEDGATEHNPEEQWQVLLNVVKELIRKHTEGAHEIRAIGLSVQRSTFTLWDRKTGEPCCNFISWADIRAGATTDRMNRYLKWKFIRFVAFIISKITRNTMLTATGMLTFVTDHALTRLRWLFDTRPDIYERAKKGELMFGTLDTWFVYRLTGRSLHVTDTSNAASTSLYNSFELKWNPVFCKIFDIPMSILPEVRETADDFGKTDPDLFGGTAIPIRSVVGDQMAALFGHRCFKRGDVKISQGSGSFVDINMGIKPKLSRRGLFPLIAWTIGGETTYMLEGYMATAGRLIDWLGQGLGLSDTPKVLNDLASQTNDSGGVVFVPTPSGIRFPYFKPTARGTIFGLSLNTHRKHVARAVIQGMAMRIVDIIEGIKKDTKIMVTGIKADGGVSRSDVLLQCLSDLTGYPVSRSHEFEMAASGAAYLAGLASGVWSSLTDLENLESEYDAFHPAIEENIRTQIVERWNRALKAVLRSYYSEKHSILPGV